MDTDIETCLDTIERGCRNLRLLLADDPAPAIPDFDRVLRLGKVASLHLDVIEEHGRMDQSDSIAIRRVLWPDVKRRRATANLFGTKDSKALFYRVVDDGARVLPTDEIRLTEEGLRIAHTWRLFQVLEDDERIEAANRGL